MPSFKKTLLLEVEVYTFQGGTEKSARKGCLPIYKIFEGLLRSLSSKLPEVLREGKSEVFPQCVYVIA